jgi:hypothetical protein
MRRFTGPGNHRPIIRLPIILAKLDMVVSEGFFIVPGHDTMVANIDTGLINLNRKYRKPVLISLSNYVDSRITNRRF